MTKFKNLIDEVLYEKFLEEEINKENNIKLFYDIDILITEAEKKEKAAEGEEVSTEVKSEVYRNKATGEIALDKNRAENTLNLENLLNVASNMIEGGKPVINKLVVEAIKTAANVGQGAIEDIFDENDKMIVDIDYGFSKKDSVGIKINKTFGSEVVSFSMKKNGNILPVPFDYTTFNNQLLDIRKRYLEG
jgi:hypothetical protein